jgi:hypothetical protein
MTKPPRSARSTSSRRPISQMATIALCRIRIIPTNVSGSRHQAKWYLIVAELVSQGANAHFSRMPLPEFSSESESIHLATPAMFNGHQLFTEDLMNSPTNSFAPQPVLIDNRTSMPLDIIYFPNVTPNVTNDARFHVKTKTVLVCTYQGCNKEFGRKPELYRHHRSVHKAERPYKCQDTGCSRFIHGFPRTDKRDDHERKVHNLYRTRRSRANVM